jgi:hemolysin activation/secretion protein
MIAGLCRWLATLTVASVSFAAVAQVIPPSEQPGRERERFDVPQPARAQPGGAAISLPSGVAPPGAESIKLILRGVKISGSTVYDSEALAPLYREFIGREITLQTVYDIARRLTAKYGGDGYVLSRAVVPPQQLNPRGAVVRIDVVEGYVDKVVWPSKLSRYRDFFTDYAAKITADRPVNIRSIERYLLLAGDLPGLKFSTSLKASATNPGASTLIVEVTEKPVDALARIDNRGTPARGPLQYLGSATVNNILGVHEALTFTYAGVVQPKQLQLVGGAYHQVLNSEGLTAFVDGSYSWGRPGTFELETLLQYSTVSTVIEGGLSYPVWRAREHNLTLSGLAFGSDSYSDSAGNPLTRDRLRGLRLRVEGDAADPLRGINQFSFTFSHGFQGFGSSSNDTIELSRFVGRVDFSKLEGYGARMQPLAAGFSAFLAAYGQYALTPLLVPEQCGYGGRMFGRAFDPSQLVGDHCFESVGELRFDVPGLPFLSVAQLYGFADYAALHTIAAATTLGTPPNVSAASVGGGVRLGFKDNLSADLSVATAVLGPRDDTRFFFILAAKH